MGFDKMRHKLFGKSVIVRTVEAFFNCRFIDEIIVVSSPENEAFYKAEFIKHSLYEKINIVRGGKTRGESSLNGLYSAKGRYVLIHDGARPLVTEKIIKDTCDAVISHNAAAPGVMPKDTVKTVFNGFVDKTVDRSKTVLIQTPQGFLRDSIISAYENCTEELSDDCSVYERAGGKIKITEGSYENIKLTTPEDMIMAEQIIKKAACRCTHVAPRQSVNMASCTLNLRNFLRRKKAACRCTNNETKKESFGVRIGTGFDTHRLAENRELIMGGVSIPYEKGLLGHSDADVVIHAVIDALLGAAALGDIGTHFPDTSEKYKGIRSTILLEETARLISESGYEIGNIDVTIIAQAPKLAPYIEKMRENISLALDININQVSIKAKTNEKMGFTGRMEGIEARAVALIN